MVQTALQGDFSLHRVAQELRVQWPEDELRRRDQGQRSGAHWNDEVLYGEEEWEAESGEKQKMVKMPRQYYKTSTYRPRSWEKGGKGTGKSQSASSWTCLRCGGTHRTGQCPDKQTPSSKAMATEAAPFICYVEKELNYQTDDPEALAAMGATGWLSTQEAIDAGIGIIDGGATKTLASVHAIEKLMEVNNQKHGDTRVSQDGHPSQSKTRNAQDPRAGQGPRTHPWIRFEPLEQ